MNLLDKLEQAEIARLSEGAKLPQFRPGDTLQVSVRVREGSRERVQMFEGVCIARAGKGINANFTVRKISYGEGVERVFPLYSPLVSGIKIKRRGEVRRAKLYYLRPLRGKAARIAERLGGEQEAGDDTPPAAPAKSENAEQKEKTAIAEAATPPKDMPPKDTPAADNAPETQADTKPDKPAEAAAEPKS